MTEKRQISSDKAAVMRRGKVVYETNPSLKGSFPIKKTQHLKGSNQEGYLIAPETGEVIASGTFGFIEEKEVDSEQFVKVYLAGIKQFARLSKAGATLFELVYREMSGLRGKGKDTVTLNYLIAQRWIEGIARRTYERGLSELLEKEFLYRSISSDVYYVNICFMFKGDCLALVRSFCRVVVRNDETA